MQEEQAMVDMMDIKPDKIGEAMRNEKCTECNGPTDQDGFCKRCGFHPDPPEPPDMEQP